MRTLYLSDLDGTLLNEKAEISETTSLIISRLLNQGLLFSIASGRTPISAVPILHELQMNLPYILANGSLLYNPQQKSFELLAGFNEKAVKVLTEAENCFNIHGLILYIRNGMIGVDRVPVPDYMWHNYFSLDGFKSCGVPMRDITEKGPCMLRSEEGFYALYTDDHPEQLKSSAEYLEKSGEFYCDFYCDIYTPNRWCLEVTSSHADKGKTALVLKERCGADCIVAFGDGRNDLPIFNVSDRSYAVMNAGEDVKAKATGVIGKNTDDGVAYFIASDYCL